MANRPAAQSAADLDELKVVQRDTRRGEGWAAMTAHFLVEQMGSQLVAMTAV